MCDKSTGFNWRVAVPLMLVNSMLAVLFFAVIEYREDNRLLRSEIERYHEYQSREFDLLYDIQNRLRSPDEERPG